MEVFSYGSGSGYGLKDGKCFPNDNINYVVFEEGFGYGHGRGAGYGYEEGFGDDSDHEWYYIICNITPNDGNEDGTGICY